MGSMRPWRFALLASACLGVGLTAAIYVFSPRQVAIHFDLMGTADRWGSPTIPLLSFCFAFGVGTTLNVLMPVLIRRGPHVLINLPHRKYWMSKEHRNEAAAKIEGWSNVFGTGLNVYLILLQGAVWAAQHSMAPVGVMAILSLAFLMFAIASSIQLLRMFKLPTAE